MQKSYVPFILSNSSPTSQSTCDTPYWACQDANWNVEGLVNSSGTVRERYEYNPYGQRQVYFSPGTYDVGCYAPLVASQKFVAGATTEPYGLCEVGHQGLIHDEECGLVYNRARYLSPKDGRFLQRDLIGYRDSFNLYEYCRSNVVYSLDPSGLGRGNASPGPRNWWEAHQKPTPPPNLASTLAKLLNNAQQNCPTCMQQAKELANALQTAVDSQDWQIGGNTGNVISTVFGWVGDVTILTPTPWGNQCADWQQLLRNAIQGVQDKYGQGKGMCFDINAVSGNRSTWHGTFYHSWIEISGPNGTVPIDPWPSGGDQIIDGSRTPDFSPIPGGNSKIGSKPPGTVNPCCK